MNKSYLPFALPDIDDNEINAVVECMKSGWVTTGPNAKKFEEDFANYIGGEVEAVALNSATMGLLLALEALGVKRGDEVIVPTYTFSATGMMPIHLGAKPVLVDVDPVTLNIDLAAIEKAITPQTKAIIPVHFAGLACDMKAINALAKHHNLAVIEDSAHVMPGTTNGVMVGNNTSDVTVYSFYATKTITTGEGGMIVTSNPEIAKRIRIMRLHGISRDVFDRYSAKGSKWFYEIVAPGSKCNLTDIAASIGIEQLKKADAFLASRTLMANRYLEAFKELPVILPAEAKNGNIHSWHLFVMRLTKDAKMTREEFITKMDEAGIGTSVHFIPLHLHPFYQNSFGYKRGDFPNAERAFDNAVSIPMYTKMTDADQERVIEAVRKILC